MEYRNVITDEMVAELKDCGCSVDTWHNCIEFGSSAMQLELEYYKTGNISSAKFKGAEISNSQARRYLEYRVRVNISTGQVYSKYPELERVANELLDKIARQVMGLPQTERYQGPYDCTCRECGKIFEAFGDYIDICPDCGAELKKASDAEKRAQVEQEMGLPELIGTPKQVKWAWEIRERMIKGFEKSLETRDPAKKYGGENYTDEDHRAVCKRLVSHDQARWWIDNRYRELYDMYPSEVEEYKKFKQEQEEVAHLGEVSNDTYVVRPEAETEEKAGAVKITMMPDYIDYIYGRDTDFIGVMHDHECRWTGNVWRKRATVCTPSIEDLTAEIGADLINHGFVVDFPTAETMQAAIDETYEPEHHRWIKVCVQGDYKGYFAVCYPGRSETLYEASRKIKGSRWDRPHVVVPRTSWKEILDFCDAYNFRLAPSAQKIADEEKAKYENAPILSKRALQKAETEQKKAAPDEIPADLVDDDDDDE